MYSDLIDSFIDRTGKVCSFMDPVSVNVGAFTAIISPMNYRYVNFAGVTYEESGAFDDRCYLLIGKASDDITQYSDETVIICAGIRYRIDSAERCFFGEDPLYCRAVIKRVPEDEVND